MYFKNPAGSYIPCAIAGEYRGKKIVDVGGNLRLAGDEELITEEQYQEIQKEREKIRMYQIMLNEVCDSGEGYDLFCGKELIENNLIDINKLQELYDKSGKEERNT